MDPVTLVVGGLAGAYVTQVKSFIDRAGGPLADEIGQLLVAEFRQFRAKNTGRVFVDATQQLDAAKLTPHAIPPRVLLPILEGASLEDDAELSRMWASLLANAAVAPPSATKPIFAAVLRQLAPIDAHILQLIAELQEHRDETEWGVHYETIQAEVSPELCYQTASALDTLKGLGLLNFEPSIRRDPDGDLIATDRQGVALSNLGRDFLQACTAPGAQDR